MSNRDLNIMDTLDMWPLHLELPLVAATISSASYLQITVVFAFFYWLLNARVRAMVNIMTARIHEAYEGGSVKQASSLHHSLSQIQLKKREKLTKNKDLLANAINNSLFETKTEKWGDKVLHLPQRRPITGMSCSHCTPTSRKSAPGNSIPGVNILNLEAFSQRPKGILAGTFATLSHCITFPNHTFPYIYDSVLQDETVQDAVRQTADEIASELGITDNHDLQILLANNKKRAVKILTRMHSKMSNFVIKAIAWILHKTLPRLFRSMTIPAHQLDMLREASKKGIPIIYLPLHRSHIDYVALTFTLCNNGLRSPLVAAGANLNIPFFGRILQGLGAFFIKRRIDPVAGKKDKIYRALLHTYMTHCIEAGHHFEFFIEGGRTRTGKPCMPKGGLLSVFVDAYLTGVLEDALLVPVSVNYERIVEGSFVRELTGEPKKPETFLRAIKGIWKALTDKYGMVRVDFNQPFSLHELVGSFQGKLHGNENRPLHVVPSSASLYGTDVIAEDQRNLVDSIARHIIFDCARSTAVMSTNALAFLLLHVHRKGATLGELTFSLDVLRDELLTSGKDLGFSGESKDALEHAIDLLGPGLVQKEKTTDGDVFVKPVTISPNVIELAYYSNSLLPHFSLESVLALAIVSLTKGVSEPRLEQEKLIETSVRLCEILQYEFIFSKTCQSLENSLRDVIDDFCLTQILVKIDMPYARTRRGDYLGIGESDDDDVYVPPQRYTVNASHPKCQLYSRLIRPIVDAYAVTASYIKSLGDRGVEETVLVREVLGKTTTLIREGIIPNGETLSMEHVKNCLKLLDKWQAVNVTVAGSKKIYVVDDLKADEALDRISLFDA